MITPQWTPEQIAAMTLRGRLLVAAAAGSGKTAVLVERLIRRITDPEEAVDVDRFLVVTFTKAAANEMRERVGKALDNALFHEHETEEFEHLLRQRSLLQRANITTLHSFCLELIRKYFYQLELDPAFRVADQAEADLLRQDAVEELFETLYEREDTAFLKLVDAFGSDRDDHPLMDHILRLYEFAYSQPLPEVWLRELGRAYMWTDIESMISSEWGQAIREGLVDLVSESINLLERAEQITQRPSGPAIYSETLLDDLARVQLLNRALREGNWSQVEVQFQSAVVFPRLPAKRSKTKKKSSDSDVDLKFLETDEVLQKALQEESKKLRDEAKKKLLSLKEEVFAYPIEQQLPALREMGTMAQTLGQLVMDFSQLYAQAKEHRNVLDFTDLEHFALRLLEDDNEPSLIAQGLKEFFTEVLVDEYQDINPVQERILQLVSKQGEFPNLFMVGDVKQSIYRFRMADPGLFLNKYNTLPHWCPSSLAEPSLLETVIDLNRNFRSRREVVEGVNFLFRQIMTKGAGEILYDDQAALQYGASFVSEQDQLCTAEGPIEVHLIDPKGIKDSLNATEPANNEDGSQPSSMEDAPGTEAELSLETEETIAQEDIDKARIEARLVSERIQRMVKGSEFRIYDKELKDFREIRYSDIVILMRSYSAVAPTYVEEFQSAGIPVYAETTTGYFGASEVETMLSLLKAIDNPRLDIPLAAVLRSSFVGLNGRELGKIRMMLPEGDFYEALTLAVWAGMGEGALTPDRVVQFKQILSLYEESLPRRFEKAQELLSSAEGLKDKVTEFWLKLQTWRTKSRNTSLADLIWSLYEETGYLAYVGTLPSGGQRQANLRVLYDRASRFEATRSRGLFRFLRFLDRFQGQGKDMGNARVLGENENVVRLITVHASKGLEFPVVFVVGLGRTFNTQSLKGKILLHSKLGLGMPIIDVENNVRYPSLIQYAVKRRLSQESLAEELRILYVALTRAKERLFLYGNVENFDNTLHKWNSTSEWNGISLPEALLRSAKCFLDWIGPALARHPKTLFGETEEQSALAIPEVNSHWEIHLHQSMSALKLKEDFKEVLETTNVTKVDGGSAGEDLKTEVYRRLNWQYPHLKSVRQVAKTSVSELKRKFSWYSTEEASPFSMAPNRTAVLSRPKFLQSSTQTLTPAERGTAMHTAMQHIPFKEWAAQWARLDQQEQLNQVVEFLNLLEQREILSAEQTMSIQPKQIIGLLTSPLGQRLFSAKQLLREVPFTLTYPSENETKILVQGVIDVVIISEDANKKYSAEILDYKTDSFPADNPVDPKELLQKRYAFQLSLYALAIERLLKLSVSQCTLYSFTLSQEIAIPNNEHERTF
ncbi:MAG: UvrD-helicase domain-containing protein [Bacillota bacterium]|nr:UvrD-helicase domain-containing protein [Bacillota bacterium]